MSATEQPRHRPSFELALDAALRVASVSPSSHNAQPWALLWLKSESARRALADCGLRPRAGREYLTVALDAPRVLCALPGHALEMDLSSGAFLYALAMHARRSDYAVERVEYHDAACELKAWTRWPPAMRPQCTLELSAAQRRATSTPVREAEWSARITNRGPYRTAPIARDVVQELERACAAARIDPSRSPSTRLHVFQAQAERARAAAVIRRYAALDFTHPAAWSETYRYMRFADPERCLVEDGLPISQLFGPMSARRRRLLQFWLAPARMAALRYAGVPQLIAASTAAQFRAGPGLIALTVDAEHPSFPERLGAGAALMQTWLSAAGRGLGLHPLSVVVQHAQSRIALQQALGLRERICFFARIGYPSAAFAPAPKRPHRDVFKTL